MNWEKSKAITDLKRDFLNAFFAQKSPFFLSGGSALGIFYLQHRMSFDMDFFSMPGAEVDWHLLTNTVLDISRRIDAKCEILSASPQFRRFQLVRKSERELLDFVLESTPQIESEKKQFGNIHVDTLHELAVNKMCTLIGRCEQKDLIDLYFLSKHGFDPIQLLADARKKEGGIDPSMISFILSQIKIDKIPEYVLEPVTPEELNSFIEHLRNEMSKLSFPS
jgi:predicted nucleotidyltransferase component of viral defense system